MTAVAIDVAFLVISYAVMDALPLSI